MRSIDAQPSSSSICLTFAKDLPEGSSQNQHAPSLLPLTFVTPLTLVGRGPMANFQAHMIDL